MEVSSAVQSVTSGQQQGQDPQSRGSEIVERQRNDGPAEGATVANSETGVSPPANESAQGAVQPTREAIREEGVELQVKEVRENDMLNSQFQAHVSAGDVLGTNIDVTV